MEARDSGSALSTVLPHQNKPRAWLHCGRWKEASPSHGVLPTTALGQREIYKVLLSTPADSVCSPRHLLPPKRSCSFSPLTSWLTLPPLTPDRMKPPLRAALPLPRRCPNQSPDFLPSQGLSVYFRCPVWSLAGGCCYGDRLMG